MSDDPIKTQVAARQGWERLPAPFPGEYRVVVFDNRIIAVSPEHGVAVLRGEEWTLVHEMTMS